jgi:hypothetical protein
MADKIGTAFVELTLDGSKFTADLKKAGNQTEEVTKKTEKLGTSLDNLKVKYFAVSAGITAALASAKKFVDMYMEQERYANKLAKAMANVGQYTEQNFKSLVQYAEHMQRITIYGDEAILSMMQLLQTFGMTQAEMKRATNAAIDLASAMDMDLNASALLVGKAFAGQTATLARYGIILQDSKDKAGKFNEVLTLLEKRFGGSAQAELNSYYGRLQNLKNILGDLGELVGQGIIISFESLLWSVDKLESAIVNLISIALKPLEDMLGIISALPYNIGEAFKSAYNSLHIFRAELDTYANMTSEEAAKQMKVIIDLQNGVSAGQYKNRDAYRATTEAIKEQTDAMDEHVKMYEAEIKANEEIYKKQLKMDEERSKSIENYINALQEAGTVDIDDRIKNLDVYNNEELEMLNELTQEQIDSAKHAAQENEKYLKETEENSRDTFNNMASFYRDALMQMGNDTGSFLDMVKSKLKNLAASVASQALTSITMSVFRGIGGLASGAGGGGGGIMSVLGGLGGGGSIGGGGGMSIMDMLSGGKTAYGAYGGSGGGIYGMNIMGYPIYGQSTALPASVGGGPLPAGAAGVNWLGGGLGAAGAIYGGYGMYQSYKAGSPGGGALAGAGAGLGVSTAMASGMLGSAAAGAAAGSWFPVIGTIIGAIVGAAVGAMGMNSAKAEQERMRRAASYNRQLGEAANADISKMSLSQYAKGADQLTGSKNVYAAIKYGGMSGNGVNDLFKISDIVEGYVDNVETFGESSANAIGSFTEMTVEMDRFAGISRSWSGAARQTADAWLQVYNNVKQLQIKAVVEAMDKGVGVFTSNLKKLELLGMDTKELMKIQYEKTLGFLTTDTFPALRGELTKARDKFKEAAIEMEKMAASESDAAIKTAILRSELALTEQQLETLRSGDVNTAMINLYTALGLVDKELVLVKASTNEAETHFESLETVAKSMKDTLDSLAQQFQGLDVSDEMRNAYSEVYKLAAGIELIAKAGQKIEALPEIYQDMADAIEAGDVLAFSDALLEAANSATYLGAALQQANMEKLAGIFLDLGTAGAIIYGVIQVTMVAVRGLQVLTKVIYETPAGKSWIDDLIEKLEEGGLMAKWMADQIRLAIKPAEDVTGTLRDVLGSGNMSVGEAGGVYQGYVDRAKYAGLSDTDKNIAMINAEADAAVSTLADQIKNAFEAASADGKITTEEWKNIHAIAVEVSDAVNIIRDGVEAATLEIEQEAARQKDAAKKAILEPIEDIIGTAGMSDYEKQVYQIQQQTNDWIVSLKNSGASLDELRMAEEAQAVLLGQLEKQYEKANTAFQKQFLAIIDKQSLGAVGSALYDLKSTYDDYIAAAKEAGYATENITQAYKIQAEAIINDFWQPVVDNIKNTMDSLTFSQFNRAVGVTRASRATEQYNVLKAEMLGAGEEDFKTAYDKYSAFTQTYLSEMQNTYASSGAYLEAFEDVMNTLDAARTKADKEWQNMLSGYEKLAISKQETQILDFAAYKKRFDRYADNTEALLQTIAANTGRSSNGRSNNNSRNEDIVFVSAGPRTVNGSLDYSNSV